MGQRMRLGHDSRLRSRHALLAGLLTACSVEAGGEAPIVRDSVIDHDGTTHRVPVVANAAPTAAATVWRVATEPRIEIGGADAPESAALHRVAGAARLSSGYIAVADGGSSSIRVFDQGGALAAVIGGPGEGPGEFRGLRLLRRLPGDSLLVYDLRLSRISVFDEDGRLAREARIGVASASPAASIEGVLDDSSLLARGFIDLAGRVPSGHSKVEAPIFHLDGQGIIKDTLARAHSEAFFVPFDGGFTVTDVPFARRLVVQAAGRRILVGSNDVAELIVFDSAMRPLRVIRWSVTPRAVDGAARERALEAALQDVTDENRRRQIERAHTEMTWPARMPVFSHVIADDGADIWVAAFRAPGEAGPAPWWVFDPDGRRRATIDLPERFVPLHIGADYILGTWRDELGVESVRLYDLLKS